MKRKIFEEVRGLVKQKKPQTELGVVRVERAEEDYRLDRTEDNANSYRRIMELSGTGIVRWRQAHNKTAFVNISRVAS